MGKTYTFSKVSPLGDYDEQYGQTYWGEVNEQLQPVMFNSKERGITNEDRITAEEVLIKEGKKGEYHRLKKITLEKAVRGGGDNPPLLKAINGDDITELMNLTRENNKMLKQLIGVDEALETPQKPQEDTVAPVVDGEPIDLADIPF